MAHDEGRVCRCVAVHRPQPLELERHHVLPIYLGGPDVEDNVAWICPNTHMNVHEILRRFMRDGPLDWGEALKIWPGLNRYAFALAHRGYNEWRSSTTMLTL
jgi:HNH endonuclease